MLRMRSATWELAWLVAELTAWRRTPCWGSARTPGAPSARARHTDSGGLLASPPGRRSSAPGRPSLPGVPMGGLFIVSGCLGGVGAALEPCLLADACTGSCLTPGAGFPERLRPLGPGFLASPIRSPSFHLWLVASGCDPWSCGDGLGFRELEACSHESMSSRTATLTRYHTCFRSSGGQLMYISLRLARFRG